MKKEESRTELIWAYLVHLGFNFWWDNDYNSEEEKKKRGYKIPDPIYQPYLRFDTNLWKEMLPKMVNAGVNMVIIDIGDGIKWESHPEIGVRRAWSTDRLRREVAKLKKMGLEPIPKLNFSACHDLWMGEYSRMLSTKIYYEVCRDLIREAIDIFDKPRLFHLGMDEENWSNQRYMLYTVIRQKELWWHDLYFYVNEVEKGGARGWVWSDYMWQSPEDFFKHMPKSILQSNWYYYNVFTRRNYYAKNYCLLEEHGYDQVPTGSIYSYPDNMERTVPFCEKVISREHLKGFMMAPWFMTMPSRRDKHMLAIEQLAKARKLSIYG
jgi:hypothetical protein